MTGAFSLGGQETRKGAGRADVPLRVGARTAPRERDGAAPTRDGVEMGVGAGYEAGRRGALPQDQVPARPSRGHRRRRSAQAPAHPQPACVLLQTPVDLKPGRPAPTRNRKRGERQEQGLGHEQVQAWGVALSAGRGRSCSGGAGPARGGAGALPGRAWFRAGAGP